MKIQECYNERLNSESTGYREKCQIVSEVWTRLADEHCQHGVQDVVRVMEWGKHHTLNVVLDGRWALQKESFEGALLATLARCERGLAPVHRQFHYHFQTLARVIRQPWDNEVLRGILQGSASAELAQKEISYFANESGYATSMRIKKLVDAQCEDFAINLCAAYLKCLKLFENGKVTLAVTEDQKKYTFDVYVALLYRVRRIDAMVNLLSTLSDKDAKELVARFASKNAVNCKVWRCSYKVTFFSAMIFLHRLRKSHNKEATQTVLYLMKCWIHALQASPTASVNEIINALKSLLYAPDTSSAFIFTVIFALEKLNVRQTRVELYIRALNKDLNFLETLKVLNDHELANTISQKISGGLLKLAEELDDHLPVARECVMTAFSLNPTKDIFQKIEAMAVRCGLDVLDTGQWDCKFHAPTEPGDNTSECSVCKKHMKQINLRAFTTNLILSDALNGGNVGLPQEICDDLVIILCSPRYQLLSWLQDWSDLHRLCIMYLDNPHTTKNYITELKFVHIDYSLFQNVRKEPREITLGYDVVMEDSGDDDDLDIQFGRKSNGVLRKGVIRDSSDEEELEAVASTSKTDPQITAALRMFRKRKLEESLKSELPNKMAVIDNPDSTVIQDDTNNNLGDEPNMQVMSCQKISPPISIENIIRKDTIIRGQAPKVVIRTSPPQNNSNLNMGVLDLSKVREELILEDVSKINKDNMNLTLIEEVIGQKIKNTLKHKSDTDSYSKLVGDQPKYRRMHKPIKHNDYFYEFTGLRKNKIDTEEERADTSPNVLKSDNHHSGQKVPDVKEPPTQEKTLFREKGFEGIFNEETAAKIVKKPHRESHENKENSGYIIKRVYIKGKMKKKPKKAKADSEVEYEIISLLEDVKVVIDRLKLPPGKTTFTVKNDSEVFDVCNRLNRKLPRRPFADKNQRALENWRVKNPQYKNLPMNPQVRVRKLEEELLANVPGMDGTLLIRPEPVRNVVQVVQTAGRAGSSASSSTQTSTQVTPHIQRVGQPRPEKPETQAAEPPAATTSKGGQRPSASPAAGLGAGGGAAGRAAPVINILSNQIIRPASAARAAAAAAAPRAPAPGPAPVQANSTMNRSTTEPQVVSQTTNQPRSSTTTGSGSTIKVATSTEPSRIVQFICQSSDGKLIPVSSFAQNCIVKVASSQSVSPTSPSFEDSFPKVKSKPSDADSENAETLPKFQQAFGKSVYQAKQATNSTNVTNHEAEKPKKGSVPTTTATSVGVIYTRQVQGGQTINLIPQRSGQVFRIATSNSEQISVVKDTLIQNKMNALLAAALSKKDSEETEEKQEEGTRVAITRPGLVQNARIVKPVLQIPSNVIRNTPQNMSSTTLEQLREFDMVYKQVKERSSTTPSNEASANSETSEPQCISVTYLNQGQKINCSPIVVVSSYNTIQPASSPAVNVVSQGNTSPRITPSPSQSSSVPKVTPKPSKGKTVKAPALQNASKASPIPKPQQKPQEDEHTTQRIFDILAEYAEQLRNSPDLNNKPAPRRRSNPPTNPSQNSKRKKSSGSKKPSQSGSAVPEPDTEDPRTLGSEDSSCGVMQLSVTEDEQPNALASTSESNDSTSTPRQQLILTDSSNQPRNLIIAESSVGEALKMPNTAVLVPGNYIMPVSMVKGGQQIAVVSGGSKILATVPARSGPNMLLFQSFLNQNRKSSVPTVKYSTIQPISGISSQSLAGVTAQPPVILPPLSHSISTVTLGQPITVKKLDNSELLLTISQSRENDSPEDTPQPDSSTNVAPATVETVEIEEASTLSDNSSEKGYAAAPVATPVIAQTGVAPAAAAAGSAPQKEEAALSEPSATSTQTVMTLNIAPVDQKSELRKTEERIQTVLVSASSSNGSMITSARTTFKDSTRVLNASQQSKDDFLRNNEKRTGSESKNSTQSNNAYPQPGAKSKKAAAAAQRLDRELQQLCLQRKQAALERELRLQKSLSEECEDLGVDEPSTSDLFPEAELLFDSGKEENDFLFEGAAGECEARTNGQGAERSPEDATLLRTRASMSDVTLNSPILATPPPLHKYVHKYSNRKKGGGGAAGPKPPGPKRPAPDQHVVPAPPKKAFAVKKR